MCQCLDMNNKIVLQFYNEQYWNVIFYSNMLAIYDIDPYSAQNTLATAGLWSISVEIKFYLAIAILMTLGRTKYRAVLVGGLILSLLLRIFFTLLGDEYAYSHMFYIEAFFVGAIIHQFQKYISVNFLHVCCSLLFIAIFPSILSKNVLFIFQYILLLICLGILVHYASIISGNLLMSKQWRWLGERSYSIYVLHFHVLALSGLAAQLWVLNYNFMLYNIILCSSMTISLIFIDKIYMWIEKPIINYSRIVTLNSINIHFIKLDNLHNMR